MVVMTPLQFPWGGLKCMHPPVVDGGCPGCAHKQFICRDFERIPLYCSLQWKSSHIVIHVWSLVGFFLFARSPSKLSQRISAIRWESNGIRARGKTANDLETGVPFPAIYTDTHTHTHKHSQTVCLFVTSARFNESTSP